jgi:mono/diheme cytochrome c family protein
MHRPSDRKRAVGARSTFRFATVAVGFAVLVGACGGGGGGDDAPSPPAGTPAAAGERLVEDLACLSCHTTNGKKGAGPTWKGIAGRRVKLSDGRTIVADDEYLRRAILDPSADVVAGYPGGLMAASVRPGSVTREQADQIAAYLHTLR